MVCEKIVCLEGSYYDEAKQKCAVCPTGTWFNVESKRCETGRCPEGSFWDVEAQQCHMCIIGQVYN